MISFKKILCPTDFSKPALKALGAAKELAARFGSEIVLFHAVDDLPAVSSGPIEPVTATFNVAEYQNSIFLHARKSLRELADEHQASDLSLKTEIVQGKPAQEIVRYAEDHGIDLIVMATHGTSEWKRFIFGSVAEKVVRSASCPVLTIQVGED